MPHWLAFFHRSAMHVENIVGIAAGSLTAVAMLPQLVKVLRQQKADDLSPWAIGLLLCGLGMWIWYGALRNDLPVLLTNSFSALVNLLLLACCFWCKKNK